MKSALFRLLLSNSFSVSVLACIFVITANAAEVHAPATVLAGQGFSISFEGSGQATFYLLGPDHVAKRTVNLGGDLQVKSSEVQAAGRYEIIVCAHSCNSTTFEVKAAQPSSVSFFLHPSRAPISTRDAIDAFAFVLDPYFNLILAPAAVDFQIRPASGSPVSRRLSTRDGVTWMHMDSTPHEGQVQVTAETGGVKEARVVQQVAAEACGLRVKAAENRDIVALESDPVRDCSGNLLPDGTIVSFTKVDNAGRSTVDIPIKKGVVRTQFKIAGPARISIACGVVVGNEVALNGRL